mmetsp:Transcript_13619/g.22232  ORF Transcript_13619/g.22232 Transcript_13619/m.22232 type:complete len:234 (+) Transcript_13619:2315-3016(+)
MIQASWKRMYAGGTFVSKRSHALSISAFGRDFRITGRSLCMSSSEMVSSKAARASVERLIARLIRSLTGGKGALGSDLYSRNISSASRLARSRRPSKTSSTSCGLIERNSSLSKSMDEMISNEEQITPHLLAELSLTITTPAFERLSRAPGVKNKFAPSTTSGLDGVPSSFKYFFQLESLIVAGRPPAGTNASATTRLCIVFLALIPAGVSARISSPFGPSLDLLKPDRGTTS